MPSACFGVISNVPLLLVLWINTGGTETKNIKNLSPSAKKTGRDVILHVRHNCDTILNINHLKRT